ncbi:MAG: hypothetical protein GY756_20220, partial [bacterium]|nr:hypothetical protein [bacterium]
MKLVKISLSIIVLFVLILTSCGPSEQEDPVTPPTEEPNRKPVASAGDNQIFDNIDQSGILVSLNGNNSSDDDNDKLTYSWSMIVPSGSSSSLNNTTAIQPTFNADISGVYEIKLEVTDTSNETDSAIVEITIYNVRPKADAGENRKIENYGTRVSLNGDSSSDSDGDNLSYSWKMLSKPDDSKAELDDSEIESPSFEGDKIGTYEIQLIVNDGKTTSALDTVLIKVGTPIAKTLSDTKKILYY